MRETNLQEMIRTNHDWIDTAYSKEYVMYKRREETEFKDSRKPKSGKVPDIRVDDPF